MQIHELTKRRRTDEGLLDTVRDGISAVKTGYKQGGLGGALKASVSNTAMAQAGQQRLQKQSEKDLADLKAKGIDAKKPLLFYVNQLKNPTDPEFQDASDQSKQEIQKLVPAAEKTFVVGPVLPDPGQVLMVTAQNGGKYYKDVNNKWYNEVGKAVPATGAAGLESLIDNDQYSQTSPPSFLSKAPVAPVKGKLPAPAAPTTTQPPAQSPVQEGTLSQRAAQRNAGVTQTPAQVTQQTAQQTTVKPSKVRGKKSLKAGFEQWIAQSLKGFNTISTNDKQVLNQKFKQLLLNKNEATLTDYIITAQAAILKAQTEQGIDNDVPAGEPEQAGDLIQRMKQSGIKSTGKPEIDQQLQSIGVPILKESQVYITKDIRVKTSKGDYVKRHEDQEWYDPNGVLIDATKYPEYIAKLDATPQAQTRYQADAEKGLGSIEGVKKERELAANQPKPVPQINLPQATAADWEQVRAHRNDMNNMAIDKTVNDLRNAEYFNTGQKEYLQQQLAQLMAKKF